jgi:hypothetical protein
MKKKKPRQDHHAEANHRWPHRLRGKTAAPSRGRQHDTHVVNVRRHWGLSLRCITMLRRVSVEIAVVVVVLLAANAA